MKEIHPSIITGVLLNPHFFTDEEYKLICDRFIEKRTLKKIAGGRGAHYKRLKQVLEEALSRMADRLHEPLYRETREKIRETLEGQEGEEEEARLEAARQEWNIDSAMPDVWQTVHHCEDAGLDIYETETIVNWYIFFKMHDAATLEQFLQKFAEGSEKKDFYEFSKFCIGLYRDVHQKRLTKHITPGWREFIKEQMAGAVSMDQLGDEYHEDSENDYWQTNASIAGPDDRELPRSYLKLMGSYKSFEEFIAAHKEFDRSGDDQKNNTVKKIRTTLRRTVPDFDIERLKAKLKKVAKATENRNMLMSVQKGNLEDATTSFLDEHFSLPK